MNQLVEYIMIGGTIILLGGAVAAILVASVIGIYVKARFGLMEVRRFQTYARHEAPPFYWVARSWSRNLLITTFALVLLEIVFMFVMFKFFYNPEAVEGLRTTTGPQRSLSYESACKSLLLNERGGVARLAVH